MRNRRGGRTAHYTEQAAYRQRAIGNFEFEPADEASAGASHIALKCVINDESDIDFGVAERNRNRC